MQKIPFIRYVTGVIILLGFIASVAFSGTRAFDFVDITVYVIFFMTCIFALFMQYRKDYLIQDKRTSQIDKGNKLDKSGAQTKKSRILTYLMLLVCAHVIQNGKQFTEVYSYKIVLFFLKWDENCRFSV